MTQRGCLVFLAVLLVGASGCIGETIDPGARSALSPDSGADDTRHDGGGSASSDTGALDAGQALDPDAGSSTVDESGDGGGGGSADGGARADAGGATAADAGSLSDTKPSSGCGKTPTLTNKSTVTISSGGTDRKYILWLPDGYDNNHPYRLILAYHWYTGSAQQVVDCTTEGIRCYTTQSPFYGLFALSGGSTIFIAPDGLDAGWANTDGRDLTFTDDILKQVEADLCIDTTRVFANGFSYGASMTNALACARPDVFRAVAVYSGTEFLSGCTGGTTPVAYYGSHGLGDGTIGIADGRKIRDRWVKNNGCTAQTPPSPAVGSGKHLCTSYDGCSTGHPVRWCEFDGSHGHNPSPIDPGQSTTWNPAEVWNFFTQF